MRRKVLIAGAGQLGSRYLQGLARVEEPLEIWVFDLQATSLIRADDRWKEMHHVAGHAVRYVSSLGGVPNFMDLAIVATTADVRLDVVVEICNYINVRHWVLEKVLTQSVNEITQIQNALNDAKSAWVNTPRYLWPLYNNIRLLYPPGAPIEANFDGFDGLACNSIHYIDFVGRWNGAVVTKVDASGLYNEWYASKRKGFYEVNGEILIRFDDSSKLRVASDRNNLGYSVTLKIAEDVWKVSEVDGVASCSDGRMIAGATLLQSQITAPMVEAIFAGIPCGLPTLSESAQQHNLFLNTLLNHWNKHMPNKVERIPIT